MGEHHGGGTDEVVSSSCCKTVAADVSAEVSDMGNSSCSGVLNDSANRNPDSKAERLVWVPSAPTTGTGVLDRT